MKNTGYIEGFEEQRAENKANFDKLSQAIGKYILSFENLLAVMKSGISFLFNKHGMNNQDVVDVIIADMTAEPLLKRFDGLIAVTFMNEMKDKETLKRLNILYKDVEDAIKYRNKIAHAHWHLRQGVNVKTDQLTKPKLVAKSQKIKRNKGIIDNFPNVDFNIIDELLKKSEENYNLANSIYEVVINIREKYPLKKTWNAIL